MAVRHEIYLPEQEIGDLLWKNWDAHFFPPGEWESHRELEIAGVRPDFVSFVSNQRMSPRIIVSELKITANLESVRQLIAYLDEVNAHLNMWRFKHGRTANIFVEGWLIARNIDADIVDMCRALDIALFRVRVKSKSEVEVEHYASWNENGRADEKFIDKLEQVFGGANNGAD